MLHESTNVAQPQSFFSLEEASTIPSSGAFMPSTLNATGYAQRDGFNLGAIYNLFNVNVVLRYLHLDVLRSFDGDHSYLFYVYTLKILAWISSIHVACLFYLERVRN
jgi:hypothetical protein